MLSLFQPLTFLLLSLVVSCNADDVVECPIVETVDPFDLDAFISATWHVQQQALVSYQPIETFFCVHADYEIFDPPTFPFGYTVDVTNSGAYEDGTPAVAELCGFQTNQADSKLSVAPCFLPKALSGPYWVVAYNETEGYALISGGQPTIPTDPNNITAGCTTGIGLDNDGLWVFTREQTRNQTLVDKVRGIAQDAGFDLTVLLDVAQDASCIDDQECADEEDEFDVGFGLTIDCDWVGGSFTFIKCILFGLNCPETCGLCDDD